MRLKNSRFIFWLAFTIVVVCGLITALLVVLFTATAGFERAAVPVGLAVLVMNLWAALMLVYWNSVPEVAEQCGVKLYPVTYPEELEVTYCTRYKGHPGAHVS